jgi:hypothetical protein
MKPAFTPGPWITENFGGDVHITEGGVHHILQDAGDTTLIGFVMPWDKEAPAEATANACLIAAAPDLYEALSFIASQENLTFAECSLAEEIIDRAKAALAKARGEA